MGKYLKNYANMAEYNSDTSRPTDSSVVSNIEKDKIIYAGKNVFVDKISADIGDIQVIHNGVTRYIKLDTYDASLITVQTVGVVYDKVGGGVRVVHKTDQGSAQWGAPFRAKVSGIDLTTGGALVVKVNSSEYPVVVAPASTWQQVADAVLAALPTGAGWSVQAKESYIIVQRSFHTPGIDSFDVTGATAEVLCDDVQARYTGFLTPYANLTRNNGIDAPYGGANYPRFLGYYSLSGSEATNQTLTDIAPVRRTSFTVEANPILVAKFGTYEKYIEANMVRAPYSKNAIIDRDGKRNTDLLCAQSFVDDDGITKPKFPAAQKARDVGANWWLPAFAEKLNYMGKVGFDDDPINRSLAAIGGDLIRNTSNYWTSSERSTNTAWGYYSHGYMLNYSKHNSNAVRVVSAFY